MPVSPNVTQGGEGSKMCHKSVTYYLNSPLFVFTFRKMLQQFHICSDHVSPESLSFFRHFPSLIIWKRKAVNNAAWRLAKNILHFVNWDQRKFTASQIEMKLPIFNIKNLSSVYTTWEIKNLRRKKRILWNFSILFYTYSSEFQYKKSKYLVYGIKRYSYLKSFHY